MAIRVRSEKNMERGVVIETSGRDIFGRYACVRKKSEEFTRVRRSVTHIDYFADEGRNFGILALHSTSIGSRASLRSTNIFSHTTLPVMKT